MIYHSKCPGFPVSPLHSSRSREGHEGGLATPGSVSYGQGHWSHSKDVASGAHPVGVGPLLRGGVSMGFAESQEVSTSQSEVPV